MISVSDYRGSKLVLTMAIQVEFFGIPRARAKVAKLSVAASTLGEVLVEVGKQIPEWGAACLEGTRLRAGFIANLNGKQFVTDLEMTVRDGDSVLILSADVGG